ncbi:uncharacterized protein LOC109809509 [Cajanus cajan]|nr:uncharacterized protein LOC109809509 [Cajanus cajan]
MDFNILSWNIRGAVNAKGKRRVAELVRLHHPSIFIVLETHCQFSSVESFWSKLGYRLCYSMEATGHSGGIWVLMALSCSAKVSDLASHPQAMSFMVVEGSKRWVCTAVYASPRVELRQGVWAHLRELGGRITLPWLVLGDFNEIMFSSECRGGRFSSSRASQFLDVLNDCNLLDMGAKGLRFTWYRNQRGVVLAKRLDRAVCNVEWQAMFPEAYVENLCMCYFLRGAQGR